MKKYNKSRVSAHNLGQVVEKQTGATEAYIESTPQGATVQLTHKMV